MTMIKPVQVEVNGKQLSFVPVGAIEGIKITTQLSKVALPAIEKLQESGDMVQLVNAVIEGLDSIDLNAILLKLFKESTVDGFPIQFDSYFSANYGELVAFLSVIMMENFKSFFSPDALHALNTVFPKQ